MERWPFENARWEPSVREGKKMSAEMKRNKQSRNFTLDGQAIKVINEVSVLKRELDKLLGHHVSRGSREEYTRYSMSQAIQDLIEIGAPILIHKLNKEIEKAKANKPVDQPNQLLDGEEALRRKIMDMSGKGWNPLGGGSASGW